MDSFCLVGLSNLNWFDSVCQYTLVQEKGNVCVEQRGALGGCCPHTACPLLIAGRCDGPAVSVTPRPRGRMYQV
jgi:hypothetical protein